MILSTKAKEAIKTALAMTIAYGIALQMDWDKPVWAGFAVAFVSLATVGQSFNKAALRMLGTLVATVVALTIIALFIQDRWLFMLFLAAWVGYCTYMMGGAKHPYFWNVCGFVSIIICMGAGPDSINAFNIAVLRSQETGLGILVYSLVSLFLWPSSSRADFEAAAGKLASTQHQRYRAYLGLMSGEGHAGETQPLRAREVQEQTRFSQLLDAAETDTYEIWEMRQQWRQYQIQSADFTKTMEGWHENFTELQVLDIPSLLPNLKTFGAELDGRFTQIERMLADQAPEQLPTTIDLALDKAGPTTIDLALDKAGVRSLSHFHKAVLAVTRTRLQHLEALTRILFNTVRDIKGFGQAVGVSDTIQQPRAGFVLDPDRFTSGVRIMATLWLAYLTVIYVADMPGGAGFVSMAGPFGMILASNPQLPVSALFMPITAAVLCGGVIYIFVMPQLSSFIGLGLLIFSATFAICYLFAAPKQKLSKLFGLAMFIAIASITNEQTYNFLSVATTALMFLLLFLLLAITANIPFSARPELAFLRLLGRYFRSCEYLILCMHRDSPKKETSFERWKKTFYLHELSTLPTKLGSWAKFIDGRALPGTSPQQLQAVVTSLQALSYRMQELIAESGSAQAPFLVQELQSDIQAWRVKVEETFQCLSEKPDAGKKETLRTRLAEIIDHLEKRIEETLDKAAEWQLSDRDNENFYRLLGAYRGVSEALVEYAGSTGAIDWAQWQEERF
jgi:uncharacterized membrane protein YccC